jgi:uncharacterized membrane protein
MEARVRFLGHAVHPALVALPIGLLLVVPFFDVVQMWTASEFWARLCFWITIVGLGGALAAAVVGFLDWLTIPKDTRAYRVGLQHMLVNLAAVACFTAAFFFRLERGIVQPLFAPLALDWSGLLVLALGGWLGGELVQQHGMGVNEGAHLNAPSSLDRERLVRTEEALPPPAPTEPLPS